MTRTRAMTRVLTAKMGVAAVFVGALVLASAQPAGAGPQADGSMSWSLGPPAVVGGQPPAALVPLLDGDEGHVAQDTSVMSHAFTCSFSGFFGVYTASGWARTHWLRTTWAGDGSSLVLEPDGSVARTFSFSVSDSVFSSCWRKRNAALATAEAQANAAREMFASMSGSASGRVDGPIGTKWGTVGTASFDAAYGSLSYSGDAGRCDDDMECTAVPGTITASGGIPPSGGAS